MTDYDSPSNRALLDQAKRRLLGVTTIDDIEIPDEEDGLFHVRLRHPDGSGAQFPYEDSHERRDQISNARQAAAAYGGPVIDSTV